MPFGSDLAPLQLHQIMSPNKAQHDCGNQIDGAGSAAADGSVVAWPIVGGQCRRLWRLGRGFVGLNGPVRRVQPPPITLAVQVSTTRSAQMGSQHERVVVAVALQE